MRALMGYYLVQTAYTPQAWAAMLKNPHDRMEAVRPVLERLGGIIESGWLMFGEYDLMVICRLPDNVSAAALSMAVSAGGAVKAIKTTPLMTFAEGIEALKKAALAGYRPPPSDIPYFGA